MVKPVKFAHVVYQTRRFDEMLSWYRNVFEAEVVYENPALAFLTYDDEHHRFAFARSTVWAACHCSMVPIGTQNVARTT